jgi:hypothetical protein
MHFLTSLVGGGFFIKIYCAFSIFPSRLFTYGDDKLVLEFWYVG